MTTMETSRQDVLNLRVGELVEVRSESEILATLNEKGELEALPFTPKMRQFCGQRLRVPQRMSGRMPDLLEGGLAQAGGRGRAGGDRRGGRPGPRAAPSSG
jgi:hypothetical protein